MAFDPVVFRTRTLTAIVFATVMLGGLLWNGWSFFILFSVIHFGCWVEYGRLASLIRPQAEGGITAHLMSFAVIGWCVMVLAAGDMLTMGSEPGILHSIARISLLVMAATIAYRHFFGGMGLQAESFKLLILGMAYLTLPWALLMHIRSGAPWLPSGHGSHLAQDIATTMGRNIPLVVIASIWLNDTMAYLTGSFFGRRPLSRFSPKKTWEGTLGGIVLSVLMVTSFGYCTVGGEAWLYGALSLISSVVGTLGDLLESWLKRKAGVKDSGSFMPGHGGFLDRFDSLLAAVPAIWLFCMLAFRWF